MNTTKVLIVETTHHNTLSMVHAIHPSTEEIGVILYEDRSSYITKSKHIKWFKQTSEFEDVLNTINHHSKSCSNLIVISCVDSLTELLDKNHDLIDNNVIIFSSTKGLPLSNLMNKQIQNELLRKHGFKVPYSIVVNEDRCIPEDFNVYPCLVKPLKSSNGGKHIAICNNRSELQAELSRFDTAIPLQIQELIKKDFEIVVPGLSYNGTIVTPAIIHKIRERSGATTYSSVKGFDSDTQFLKTSISDVIRHIGYNGLFGFEFIFDGKNYYFIELNLRNDATCYSVCAAGINLPAIYIDLIKGKTVPSFGKIAEIRSIVEFNDFSFVLRRQVSLWKWLKQLKGAKCKFYYTTDDKSAFWSAMAYWLKIWIFRK